MAVHNHACIESLARYAGNFSGRVNAAKQPVFIQRLSTALERAFIVRITCLKLQEDCCLCQIADKINTVAERASHLQVNERSWRKLLGYFSMYTSDQLYHALEEDCCDLIQILEAYCSQTLTNHALLTTFLTAHQAANQPAPSSVPTVIASEMFKNACDININEGKANNIAGDVDMHVRFASPTTTTDWKLGLLLMLFSVVTCSLTLTIVSKN